MLELRLELTDDQAESLWQAIDDEREISSDREDEDEAKWNDEMTFLANAIHEAVEKARTRGRG